MFIKKISVYATAISRASLDTKFLLARACAVRWRWRSTKMHQLAIHTLTGKAGGNQTLCTTWPLAVAIDHSLPCRNAVWFNHETSYETKHNSQGVWSLNMRGQCHTSFFEEQYKDMFIYRLLLF